MMPKDTNAHGTIFGGHILSLVDQAGAIGAHRVGAGRVVTVALREVEFKAPVHVGDIVSCYTSVLGCGRTSIRVYVRVIAHKSDDVERWDDVTDAELVFVQVNEVGAPVLLSEEIQANVARAVASNPSDDGSAEESP
jgi:acyl-CoA thioesterase YciA